MRSSSYTMPANQNSAMRPKSIVVIMLGPPGCGKGTQARELSRDFGLVHLSTGDMLRKTAAQDSELGRTVRATMQAGRLVSDELICRIVAERIASSGLENGLILDGFPRTLEQARFLSSTLGDQKVVALNLHVTRSVLLRRVLGRISCGSCGEIYNLFFRPPRRTGICDFDGAALKRRSDDNETVVRQRLDLHDQENQSLVEYFRTMGVLEDVKADVEAGTLTAQLQAKLHAAMGGTGVPVRRG